MNFFDKFSYQKIKKKLNVWLRQFRGQKVPGFLHIPKTAGTYIARYDSTDQPVLYPLVYFGHKSIINHPDDANEIYLEHDPQKAQEMTVPIEKVEKYFVFTNVRNIFDWLVSYAGHAGGWTKSHKNENHYDYVAANSGFDVFLKKLANRDNQWPGRKLIYSQLFSSNGDLAVDWINRTESLDDDLDEMSRYIGIRYNRKQKKRVGERKKDYREYYTPELVDLVYKTWGRELKLFGYDYEGLSLKKAILKGRIPPSQKKTVKYDWGKDRLTIRGEELPRELT